MRGERTCIYFAGMILIFPTIFNPGVFPNACSGSYPTSMLTRAVAVQHNDEFTYLLESQNWEQAIGRNQ